TLPLGNGSTTGAMLSSSDAASRCSRPELRLRREGDSTRTPAAVTGRVQRLVLLGHRHPAAPGGEVGVLAFVSGMVLSLVSALGGCGPGRFGCFYGVLSSDGRALLLDKQ
ncbi:hypothetical protein, partial [Streptomyces sp. NPDC001933]|uniref:hypothetical protein n=1 Tax=Streptomyces sp. NPDC001933 TaxID=3364626 RepID=UPI00367A3E8C